MREELKQIIEKECADLDYFDYKYHLLPVVEYAAKLAEICDVDKEVSNYQPGFMISAGSNLGQETTS